VAIDAFMIFVPADTGSCIAAESQTQNFSGDSMMAGFKPGYVFEVTDFNFDVEQVLNIGSTTGGAGAGKVTFNAFTFSRNTDKASPTFFQMCCSGKHFQQVTLCMRKAVGNTGSGLCYLRFDFALAAVKTVSWSGSDGDEATKEEVSFEYGALQIQYCPQNPDGTLAAAIQSAWSRTQNTNTFTVGTSTTPVSLVS
jgi:type VI secretion system secreted protein Hcp